LKEESQQSAIKLNSLILKKTSPIHFAMTIKRLARICPRKMAAAIAAVFLSSAPARAQLPFSDDFSGPNLSAGWTFESLNPASGYQFTPSGLVITASSANGGSDLYAGSNHNGPRLLQPVDTNADWTVETEVSFSPSDDFQGAGILLAKTNGTFSSDTDFMRLIERDYYPLGGGNVILSSGVAQAFTGTNVFLRAVKTGSLATMFYSADGVTWTQIATASQADAYPFVGLHVLRQPWDGVPVDSIATFRYFHSNSTNVAASGSLIVDGGFEQPSVATYQTLFAGATNLAPWVVGGNSVDLASINNGYVSGAAYDGVQYVDMDGTAPGQLSQTFATTAGQNYFLSFAYANNYVNQPSAAMRVRVYDTNGNVFGPITVTHGGSAPGTLGWIFYTNNFAGSGNPCTIEFTSLSAANSAGGILLDTVSVSTNPPAIVPGQTMQPGDVCVESLSLDQVIRIRPDGTQIPFGPNLGGSIYGLAFDASNTLFVAHGQISKISPHGDASNFTTGSGSPVALAFDPAGDFFVTYLGVGIEQLPLDGIGGPMNVTDGPFTECAGLVVDAAGNRFTSEASANKLWKFPAGNSIGTVMDTNLNGPGGMTLDLAGNIYLSDYYSGNIYKYWPDGTHRTTFATGFSYPSGLAFDNNGWLYEVDQGSGRVYKISPDGTQRSIFASGLNLGGFIAIARGPVPVILFSPQFSGNNFTFSFQTVTNQSYTVQQNTNVASTNWLNYTNILGSGNVYQFTAPLAGKAKNFFRVSQP
jgi:hypothetical protein